MLQQLVGCSRRPIGSRGLTGITGEYYGVRGALPNEPSLLVLLARVGLRRKQYDYKVTQLGQEERYFRWQ